MRLRINGTICAARQVQDPGTREASLIWKAQVKVADSAISRHHASDPDHYQLADRVEITYPIEPRIGKTIRFTAGLGNGRSLRNPRGVAEFRPDKDEWHRIGG